MILYHLRFRHRSSIRVTAILGTKARDIINSAVGERMCHICKIFNPIPQSCREFLIARFHQESMHVSLGSKTGNFAFHRRYEEPRSRRTLHRIFTSGFASAENILALAHHPDTVGRSVDTGVNEQATRCRTAQHLLFISRRGANSDNRFCATVAYVATHVRLAILHFRFEKCYNAAAGIPAPAIAISCL